MYKICVGGSVKLRALISIYGGNVILFFSFWVLAQVTIANYRFNIANYPHFFLLHDFKDLIQLLKGIVFAVLIEEALTFSGVLMKVEIACKITFD